MDPNLNVDKVVFSNLDGYFWMKKNEKKNPLIFDFESTILALFEDLALGLFIK